MSAFSEFLSTLTGLIKTETAVIPLRDEVGAAYSGPVMAAHHKDMVLVDVTDTIRDSIEVNAPFRRRGSVTVHRPDSLAAIINRFKDDDSAIFVDEGARTGTAPLSPKITAIFNFNKAGEEDYAVVGDKAHRDELARPGDHRAIYNFPISDAFKAWEAVGRSGLTQAGLGEFIDTRIEDFIDPTPALMNRDKALLTGEEWEARMFEIGQRLGARFGSYRDLKELALSFEVDESVTFKVKRNPLTGEAAFQSETQHSGPTGQPIQIPGLFLVAIPVFTGGPLYRVPMAFRYRKQGDKITFFLAIYNLDDVFRRAMEGVVNHVMEQVTDENGIQPELFWGQAPDLPR